MDRESNLWALALLAKVQKRDPARVAETHAGCSKRSIQPAPEARIHVRNWARGFVRADRFRDMEAGAIFLAGVDDRRLSLGAAVAFPDHMGAARVRVRPPGHGRALRLE